MDHFNFSYSSCVFMKIILAEIELELKQRHQYPYRWYRRQNDIWDAYTNFIYNTEKWGDLIPKISVTAKKHRLEKKELFYYAINRWYNFWSAMAVENIFSKCNKITPNPNSKNKTIDFTLQNIAFDHKTSVFPKYLNNNLAFAQSNKRELIEWLYKNQSSQKRYHLKNRLFILVFDKKGEHWKLKGEIGLLQKKINKYLSNFSSKQLLSFNFTPNKETLSDIIWVTR